MVFKFLLILFWFLFHIHKKASVSQLTGVYQTRMRKYTTEEAASRLQSELEEAVKEDEELRTLSGRAFQSFIRSMRPFQKI
eukprot:Pgem_evm1s11395